MPRGGQPPFEFQARPPPATPQPEPSTGAQPGARHGMILVQSPGPSLTSTFTVRYFDMLLVGGPGMTAAKGCRSLGCEKSMQAPFKSLWLNGCFSGPQGC